jgi:hypothetical protein
VSWRAVERSPFRLWAAWEPRSWPGAERVRFDPAAQRLVWPGRTADATPLPAGAPDEPELVLLPPVPAAFAPGRDALVEKLERAGSLALVQRSPGEPAAGRGIELLDLTPVLLGEAKLEGESRPGSGALRLWAVVPLLPGVLGGDELGPLLDAVAALGPEVILGVEPALAPADRRRLVAHLGEESFDSVFHGRALGEAEFAAAVAARGIAPLPLLPDLPELPARTDRDRRLAAALQEAGELWLRLGRSEAIGESLLAASRHLATEPRDVTALAREGNVGLLGWLSPTARELITEEASGDSALLRELRGAWAGRSRS